MSDVENESVPWLVAGLSALRMQIQTLRWLLVELTHGIVSVRSADLQQPPLRDHIQEIPHFNSEGVVAHRSDSSVWRLMLSGGVNLRSLRRLSLQGFGASGLGRRVKLLIDSEDPCSSKF